MKFAKELQRDCVPEWRIKYLDYKAGKKYVKAVGRAVHRANGTPALGKGKNPDLPARTTSQAFYDLKRTLTPMRRNAAAVPAPGPANERAGLVGSPNNTMFYGGFVPTPPAQESSEFELPAPAIKVSSKDGETADNATRTMASSSSEGPDPATAASAPGPPVKCDQTPVTARSRLNRLLTMSDPLERRPSKVEIALHSLDDARERENELYRFLDAELRKIETFYKSKEDEATNRLEALREQLHEMRNRRTSEILESKRGKQRTGHSSSMGDGEDSNGKEAIRGLLDPIKDKLFKPGPNSKALQTMMQTPVMHSQSDNNQEGGRDYVRQPHDETVPYRTAKRKLKLALQEFYRGLELLKSYAILNRTAFRKLNKKLDKATNARPPYRYYNDKVNKSWFVTSGIVDNHLDTVEDLYARYFERGNHKIAAGKLRQLSRHTADASGSAFQNGLLLGVGTVFAVQGLIYGAQLLWDPDPVVSTQTSYLMQIYGGYFLMLYLFFLFTLDCRVWTRSKVNYPFIFEFDPREHLDWKQLAKFPSFFFCLFGVIIWLNFTRYGNWEPMFLYFPVVLIGLTLAILFFPAPIFFHRSRRWFIYSHYRLFFAGIYPVEFRDFFLGDIWCSLTYATGNMELFFCLYARHWNSPSLCNSSHSRLLGFFQALPGIWRALQCIRRYHDTSNIFPHLVNCGKYSMTILSAVFLSVYRVHGSHANLALFIVFSTINSIYCTIWDLFMDASLMQTHSQQFLLRDVRAIKARWPYYLFLAADPVLRFTWIFYAIFTHDTQHSSVVSFLLGLAEVTRRGLWTVFRIENEHCGNVAANKASRDCPLPYRFQHDDDSVGRLSLDDVPARGRDDAATRGAVSTGVQRAPSGARGGGGNADEGAEAEEGGGSAQRRRRSETGGKKIFQYMAEAHRQDFEKKRTPAEGVKQEEVDDEDADHAALDDEEMAAREGGDLMGRGKKSNE